MGADAARLALALDRPVYDCAIALAYRIGGQVVTADARTFGECASSDRAREIGGAVGRFCTGVNIFGEPCKARPLV